jgi:hypothetical protein
VSSCGRIERQLLDVVRGTASDAVRLEVEAHLEDCASCREARASFGLLGALRGQAPPRLGAPAERRIVERLVATGVPRARRALAPRRPGRVVFVGLAVAALGALVVTRAPRGWRRTPAASPVAEGQTTEGQTIEATQAGVIAFEGAGVMYGRGTSLTFHAATRTIAMAHGEVDVDVTEHRARHFRVTTPKFIVDVLGTHFVVTPAGVRTLRGRVRVLDLEGRELAVVSAGEAWTSPPPASPPPLAPAATPSLTPPTPVPPSTVPAPRPPASRAAAVHSSVDVDALVARARAALAEGDAARASSLIDSARAAGPAPSERPVVDLLGADALLVARRPSDAIAAYRAVLRRYPDAPEAETASFAVGQLLFERGAQIEATAALNDYVARYPHGQFVREARERLAQIRPAE